MFNNGNGHQLFSNNMQIIFFVVSGLTRWAASEWVKSVRKSKRIFLLFGHTPVSFEGLRHTRPPVHSLRSNWMQPYSQLQFVNFQSMHLTRCYLSCYYSCSVSRILNFPISCHLNFRLWSELKLAFSPLCNECARLFAQVFIDLDGC